MNHRENILAFVTKFPGRDDDEIAAALRIQPRQTVNQSCRYLASKGFIERVKNGQGKIVNNPKAHPAISPDRLPKTIDTIVAPKTILPDDWYWEGNVVDALARYLVGQGWVIKALADTGKREKGVDVHAVRSNETLLIEVKGYPSINYRDPSRAGQKKPTSPSLQAQHWFSHALLKAMRLQSHNPDAIIAMAFPDFTRYCDLTAEIRQNLIKLRLRVFAVTEDGDVRTIVE